MGDSFQEAHTAKMDILLVEDNPGDVRLTQEALKDGDLAHNLYVVNDGDAAMCYLRREDEYAEAVRPDLILLDLNLPGMPGQEVLKAVKEDADLKDIPVVVLTASEADEDMVRAFEYEAPFIMKPVEVKELVKIAAFPKSFWATVIKRSDEGSEGAS